MGARDYNEIPGPHPAVSPAVVVATLARNHRVRLSPSQVTRLCSLSFFLSVARFRPSTRAAFD